MFRRCGRRWHFHGIALNQRPALARVHRPVSMRSGQRLIVQNAAVGVPGKTRMRGLGFPRATVTPTIA